MNDKIKGALLGSIAGDALGTPLEGMTAGHIHSSFRDIQGYTDSAPALKGKMDRWKMPGLYSSISQMMLLFSFHLILQNRFDEKEFIGLLKSAPEIPGNAYGIFRHPAAAEKSFLKQIFEDTAEVAAAYTFPCARPAAILMPAALFGGHSGRYKNIFSACKMLTGDYQSIAGAFIIINIINAVTENKYPASGNLLSFSIGLAESLITDIKNNVSQISAAGISPGAFENAAAEYITILSGLSGCIDTGSAAEKICALLNKSLKTPITRATVNHPLAIIPFALYLNENNSGGPAAAIFSAAAQGGSSAVLCAVTGALAGAIHGAEALQGGLTDALVNKKRVITILDQLTSEKINRAAISDFISAESSLTKKEIEELKAKLKHTKVKTKKKKTRRDREQELTKHVVESWTKMDQARWRKKLHRHRDTEK